MAKNWKYSAFGFKITSQIELPELIEADFDDPDVNIRLDDTPDRISNPMTSGVLFQANPSEFLFKLDSVGSYFVRNGNEIIIKRLNNCTDEELRLFLLGSSFGALIHQNNLLPFHGSSITLNGKAYSIGGTSGAGKSTIAASLIQKGFSILADDISVIRPTKHDLVVYPGIPQIKLWHDVLIELGENIDDLPQIRPQLQKFRKSIFKNYVNQPVPLYSITVLSRKNTKGFKIDELKGAEKIKLIRDNIYRYQYISGDHLLRKNFSQVSEIASRTKVFHIQRPMHPLLIEELADFFLENIILGNEN